jgi:Family of unknown function (DUF6627)
MNVQLFKACIPFVIVASCFLSYYPANAAIIPTDQIHSDQHMSTERDKIKAFLDRASVKAKLETHGVSDVVARERVNALTDQEVAMLAQKIDTLPAGGTLANNDLIIILLVAILVVLAV